MTDDLPDAGRFGAAFEDFIRTMTAAAERPDSPLEVRIREHVGVDPKQLPSTGAEFSTADHPNLQLGLDAVLPGADVIGHTAQHGAFAGVTLSDLLQGRSMFGAIKVAPVQYTDIEVGDGRVVRCISSGVYLGKHAHAPVALMLSRGERQWGGADLKLEGISPKEGAISTLLGDLRAAMRERNVYRGQVISLHQLPPHQSVAVQFHSVSTILRDGVILPDGTMERLERHILGIAERAHALQAEGRPVKRGVLLHGPPGTGKTLSVNYFLSAMPGRTTVLLTGRGLGLIEQALAIARELAPATVVFEDIDLVAAERTMPLGDHGVLFELLNQMEGLDEDRDLLFLLTTNRPDIVEPALAARPGRIDLAVELPLPDEKARRRLLNLYARDITLDEESEQSIVGRTEGVSGAFIKELMRQAALRSALEQRGPATATDVVAVLDELLDERSALTRRLLGQAAEGAAPETAVGPPSEAMLRAFGAAGLPMPPDFEQLSD